MANLGEAQGLSRRSLLTAIGLSPLAAAIPFAAQVERPTPASAATYTLLDGTLTSQATGLTHNWVLTYPAGHRPGEHLPVALVLHGSDQNCWTMVGGQAKGLGYPEKLNSLLGAHAVPPFALASIDGHNGFYQVKGTHDYGKLVASEFLGLLAAKGLNTSRLAMAGWSMGGWGAFRLAQHELRHKVRAIAAVSTPCYPTWKSWPSYERGDMTHAAFDANNFYGHPGRLAGPRIYLMCGTKDGFYKGNKAFAKALDRAKGVRAPKTYFSKGSHSTTYWESVVTTQLRYLGAWI